MASWVYQTRGAFIESQAAQTHGLEVAQRLGDVVGLGHTLFLDALLAFYLGEWDTARAIAKSSLDVFGKLGLTHLSVYPPLELGWLSTSEGDRGAGEQYLAEAEKIAQQSGPAQVLRFVTALRAECELLAGRAEKANECLRPWFTGEPMQERTRLELNVLRAWAAVELGAAPDADELVADTVRSARVGHAPGSPGRAACPGLVGEAAAEVGRGGEGIGRGNRSEPRNAVSVRRGQGALRLRPDVGGAG